MVYPNDGGVIAGCSSEGDGHEMQPEQPRPPVTIRVSIFFDGTLNNRTNTDVRLHTERRHRAGTGPAWTAQEGRASYDNDYSNIAKLETHLNRPADTDTDYHFSIYIEGMGTVNNEDDDDRGTAMGSGTTGVDGRVVAGISRIISRINSVPEIRMSRNISTLKLDAFGFSRGAAAARHFIYKALVTDRGWVMSWISLKDQLTSAPHHYTLGTVELPFVGLFDTVSSFHPRWTISPDYTNDTRELNLDAVGRPEVLKVVQLAAADEHRKNFSLTNIDSAGSRGIQIFLPGVHSDIGGGYTNNTNEVRLPVFNIPHLISRSTSAEIQGVQDAYARDMRRLIDAGWYTARQFDSDPNTTYTQALTVTRSGIGNGYDRIPWNIMVEYAQENGLQFNTDENAVDAALSLAHSELNNYNDSHGSGGSSVITDWHSRRDQWLMDLRNGYFHFSAHYTTRSVLGMELIPHEPHFSNDDPYYGIRTRVIHAG